MLTEQTIAPPLSDIPVKKEREELAAEVKKAGSVSPASTLLRLSPARQASNAAAAATSDQIQYTPDGRPKLIVSIELDLIKLLSMNQQSSAAVTPLPPLGAQTLTVASATASATNMANGELLNDIVNDELKMNSKSTTTVALPALLPKCVSANNESAVEHKSASSSLSTTTSSSHRVRRFFSS